MNARNGLSGFGFVLISWAGVVACGGTSVDVADTPDGSSDGAAQMVPSDAGLSEASTIDDGATDATAVTPPVDAGKPSDMMCAAAGATAKTCATCCETDHPAGYKVAVAATLSCVCQKDVCKAVCATTACAVKVSAPDAQCQACIDLSLTKAAADAGNGADAAADDGGVRDVRGACVTDVKDACTKSADCEAEVLCVAGCPAK